MMKKHNPKMKRRWGMAIDLDRCTGCGECALACSAENNMPFSLDDSDYRKRVSFLDVMTVTNEGQAKYPDVRKASLPRMCQHCEGPNPGEPDPPCVSACPVEATDVGDDGIVSQIHARCTGCRSCMAACPYGARVFNWKKPQYEGSFKNALNPLVSIAARGTVVKCTFCGHIWKRERDRAAAKGDADINSVTYTPACVSACPTGAMVFGDLNDPSSEVSRLAGDSRAFRLSDSSNEKAARTKKNPGPKVWYLSGRQWIRDAIRFR
jgi:molybdopterin-containing oxidoreductase family iron-sulfur binding subunit